MTEARDPAASHPSRWLYPPVLLAMAILLMLVLARWAAILSWRGSIFMIVGITLVVVGLAFGFWATALFRAAGTTIKVFEESSALVTRGPYRVSRNPIYLGMAIILLGVALWTRSLSSFFVIPVFIFLIQKGFILAEEEGLERRFGSAYAEYRKSVRRWI